MREQKEGDDWKKDIVCQRKEVRMGKETLNPGTAMRVYSH